MKSSNIFSPDGFKDLQSLLYNHRENLRHKTKEVKILSEGQSFSNYILPEHFRHPPVEPSSSSRRPAFYKDTAIPAEIQTERYLTVIDTPQPSQFAKRSSRLPITDLWTGEQFFTTPYSQYSTPTTTPSTSNTGPPIKMWINNQPVAYSPDELKQNQQSHHHTYANSDRHYYEYPQYEAETLESYFPNEDAPLTGHNERDDWTSYPHHEFEYDGDQQYPLYEYFIIHEVVEETEEKPTAKPYQSEHIYNTARPSFADKINHNQPSKQILVPLDIEDQKVLVPYSITTESSLNSYKFLPPNQVSPTTPPVRFVDPSTRPSVQQLFRGDNHKFQPEEQETKSNDVPLVHFFVDGDKEDQIEQSSPITVTQSSSGQTTSDPKIQITTNNVNPETLTNILSSIQEHLNADSEASMNTTPASESSGVELVSNIEKPESIQAVQHSNNEGPQSSSVQNSNIQDSNIETQESALVAQDLDEPDIGTTTSSTPDLNSVSMSSEIDQALLNLLGLSVGNAQSDLSNLDLNEFSTLLGLSNTDLQESLSGDEMNMLSDMLSFIDSDSLGSENPSATSNNFNSKPRLPPYVISMLQGGQNAPPGTTRGQLVYGIPKAMIDSELPKVNKNTNEKNKNTDSLNKEQLGLLLDGNSAVKDMKRRPNLVATLNFLANNRARNEDIAASYGIPESLVELAQLKPNSRRGNEQTSLEKETPKESSSLLFGSLPSMVANFLGFTDELKAEGQTSSFTSRSLDVGSSYPTLQSLFGRTTAKYFKKSPATPILTSTIGAETPTSTSGYSQAIEKTVEGHPYVVDEETSDSIEDITKNFEGSTTYSHFQASQIFDQSKDSSQETTPSLNEEVSFQERDDLFGHPHRMSMTDKWNPILLILPVKQPCSQKLLPSQIKKVILELQRIAVNGIISPMAMRKQHHFTQNFLREKQQSRPLQRLLQETK